MSLSSSTPFDTSSSLSSPPSLPSPASSTVASSMSDSTSSSRAPPSSTTTSTSSSPILSSSHLSPSPSSSSTSMSTSSGGTGDTSTSSTISSGSSSSPITSSTSSSTSSSSSSGSSSDSVITSSSASSSSSISSSSSEHSTSTTFSPSPTPHPPPSSTLQSVVFITTTNDHGEITTSAPSVITTFSTSTSNGLLITVTQIVANPDPTLSNNSDSKNPSAFFSNTGAVAGVFVLVGLAAASILLWIFFAVRRRRRTQRLEHDTAVSATLAAAGFNRAPLDDDDDEIDPRASASLGSNAHGYGGVGVLPRRSSSGLAMSSAPSASASGTRMSQVYAETTPFHDDPSFGGEMAFSPFSDQPYASVNGVQQPPPSAFHMGAFRDRTGVLGGGGMVTGDRDRRISGATTTSVHDAIIAAPSFLGHHPQNSAGSHEPLLGGFRGEQQGGQRSSFIGTNVQLPPPYVSITHHQLPSSSGSSPLHQQPPRSAADNFQTMNASPRGSVYSTASGEPLVMTGIAISPDDLNGGDPFAAAAYMPPPGGSEVNARHDDRLDARMLDWMGDADSTRDLRDEEDYTRRVLPLRGNNGGVGSSEGSIKKGGKTLGVRNVTDCDAV